MEYTANFKNWVKELATEDEGRKIINEKELKSLEELYTRCTGKSSIKKKNDTGNRQDITKMVNW